MDLVIQATPVAMVGEGPVVDAAPDESVEPTEPVEPLQSTGQAESAGEGLSGMGSAVVAGVDPSWFGSGQLVVDLVYDPPLTPFLAEARRQGATVRNGLGMLVYQATRQIRLWTGAEPPLSAMWAVVGEDGSGWQGAVSGPGGWKSSPGS